MTLKLGIIGAGNIFPAYMHNLAKAQRARTLQVVGVADLDPRAAQSRAEEFAPAGLRAMTLDELFASDADVLLNLTPPLAHHEMGLRSLRAGKHFFTEKPLAPTVAQGRELLELAQQNGLRVGCAPDTLLGAGAQTVRAALDAGRIGSVRHGTAFFMNHGPDHWHPNPAFFYQPGAGPLFDVGVYHLSHLVYHLGPVASVRAVAHTTHSERIIPLGERRGQTIAVAVPTHIVTHLDFVRGTQFVLTSSFDVWKHNHAPFEFYGDDGTLIGPDPNRFGGSVKLCQQQGEWHRLTDKRPYHSNARGLGVVDMVRAIAENRPHRCSGEMALHVLEAMEASLVSAAQGVSVSLRTRCDRPAALSERLF